MAPTASALLRELGVKPSRGRLSAAERAERERKLRLARERREAAKRKRAQEELRELGFVGASRKEKERKERAETIRAARRSQSPHRAEAGPLRDKKGRAIRPLNARGDQERFKAGLNLPDIPGVRRLALELRTVATDIENAPAGIYKLSSDALKDALDPTGGRRTMKNLRRAAVETKNILSDPLKPGNTGRFAVTVGAVAAPAVSGAARVGQAGRAAASGAGVSALARELVRAPKPGEAFGPPRTFRYDAEGAKGVEVPGIYSRSPLFELAERGADALRHKFPRAGFPAGPAVTRNLPARIGFEMEQNRKVLQAAESADALGLAGRAKLPRTPRRRRRAQVAQTAARTEFEGATIAERIALHEAAAAKAKNPVTRRRIERKIGLLQRAAALLEETPDGPQVKLSNAGLRDLMVRAERVAEQTTQSRVARGAVTEERAAGRVQGPGRIVQGARYEKPTPGKLGIPSRTLQGSRARVERLQKRFDGEVAKAEARAQQLRPRNRREAEEFVEEIEGRYEQLVRLVIEGNRPAAKAVRQLTAMRNRKPARRRGKTVNEELRRYAEAEVDRMLRAASHPSAVRLREQIEEAGRLRHMLDEARTEKAFGGQPGRLDLGKTPRGRQVTRPRLERVGGALSIAKDELAKLEAAAGARVTPTGIVGAEDFQRGKVRVPYTARYENTPLGRATLGRGKTIGVPRELGVVTHAFKGGRLLTGNFRDDALRLIAEDALAEVGQTSRLHFREEMLDASTPVRVNDRQVAIRETAATDPKVTQQLQDALARPDDVLPTARARRATGADPFRQVRELVFPDEIDGVPIADIAAGTEIPGIRWVDERLLEGANKAPLGVGVAETAGLRQAAAIGRGLNNAMRLAIFYTAPKYATPNLLGQAALNYIQQGKNVPRNWATAAAASRKLGRETTSVIDEAMGAGIGKAILSGQRGPLGGTTQKAAELWSVVLDRYFRRSAWVHEARAAGFKTDAEMRALVTNTAHRGQLVRVTRRARNEILDYERLGRAEKALTGFLFIYPFTKASTVYVGHFFANHPVKAGLATQLGIQGKEEVKRVLGDVPSFMEGAVPIQRDGETFVSSPGAFSPIAPGLDVAQTAASMLAGNRRPNELPLQHLQPALSAALNALTDYDAFFGRRLDPAQPDYEQFVDELLRQTPQKRLVEGLSGEKADRDDVIYPTSPGEALRQFLIGTVSPRRVNVDAVRARAQREERATLAPAEREYRNVFEQRAEMLTLAAKHKLGGHVVGADGRLAEPVRQAWNLRARYKAGVARRKIDKLPEQERPLARFRLAAELMVRADRWTRQQADQEIRATARVPVAEIESRKDYLLREELGGYILTYVGGELRARGEPWKLD